MTDTSPPRPTLEQQPGKPDVLVRLRDWGDPNGTWPAGETGEEFGRRFYADMSDAIATIEGLRAANLRHCEDERLLKEARARCAELEAFVRKVATPIECGCVPCTGDCRSDASRASSFDAIQADALDLLPEPAPQPQEQS